MTTANQIGQRLHEAIKKSGLNVGQVAKRAYVKPMFIYDIVAGKSTNPSVVKVARIAAVLGVRPDRLAGVAGSLTSIRHAIGDNVGIPYIRIERFEGRDVCVAVDQEGDLVHFPKSWIKTQLHANPVTLLMMHVPDNSMEPTLCRNDVVMINTASKAPSPPGVFALLEGGGLKVKRIEYTHSKPPRLRVISDNPCYSDRERSIGECQIVGRIVWFSRRV